MVVTRVLLRWLLIAVAAVPTTATESRALASSSDPLAACPGYKASNIKTTTSTLTADLSLAGKACNVYGTDLTNLKLQVTYETGEWLHYTLLILNRLMKRTR